MAEKNIRIYIFAIILVGMVFSFCMSCKKVPNPTVKYYEWDETYEIGTRDDFETTGRTEKFIPGRFFDVNHPEPGINPNKGFVPNAQAAAKIAEAVWFSIYGNTINNNQPFSVYYDRANFCWYVIGTLPEEIMGSVPKITIDQMTGKILYMMH